MAYELTKKMRKNPLGRSVQNAATQEVKYCTTRARSKVLFLDRGFLTTAPQEHIENESQKPPQRMGETNGTHHLQASQAKPLVGLGSGSGVGSGSSGQRPICWECRA